MSLFKSQVTIYQNIKEFHLDNILNHSYDHFKLLITFTHSFPKQSHKIYYKINNLGILV